MHSLGHVRSSFQGPFAYPFSSEVISVVGMNRGQILAGEEDESERVSE